MFREGSSDAYQSEHARIVGGELAAQSDEVQATFLNAMADTMMRWPAHAWSMQLLSVNEHLNENARQMLRELNDAD